MGDLVIKYLHGNSLPCYGWILHTDTDEMYVMVQYNIKYVACGTAMLIFFEKMNRVHGNMDIKVFKI